MPKAQLRRFGCRIHEYQEAKGRKLEQIRNRREYEELCECTFAPAVNSRQAEARRAASRRPVLVRGLSTHLDKQQNAQRKAAEEAETRARLFLERPRSPRAKFTIARPFNLSNANPVCCMPPPDRARRMLCHTACCK